MNATEDTWREKDHWNLTLNAIEGVPLIIKPTYTQIKELTGILNLLYYTSTHVMSNVLKKYFDMVVCLIIRIEMDSS